MSLHRHVTATLSPCFPLGSTLHVMHPMCLDKRMMKHFHHLGKFQWAAAASYSLYVLGYSFPFTCFVFLAYSSLHYPFSLPNLSYSFNSSGGEKSPTLAHNRTFNSLTLSKQVLLFVTGVLHFINLKVTDTTCYGFEAFSLINKN